MVAPLLALLAAAGPTGAALELVPEAARPGDAVLLRVRTDGEPKGSLAGSPLSFWRHGGEAWAIAALPIETPPGPTPVAVELPGEPPIAGALAVVEPGFRSKSLRVADKFVVPPESARARIARDRVAIAKAYRQPFSPPLFSLSFEWPRPEPTGGRFGDQRVLNGKKASVHYGVDIGAPRGAPVHAANDGAVVLARNCYYSGNTVILWHGSGLFTLYFHMDRLSVRPGKAVRRGDVLGVVGSTGRSTGPHLHWSAKVGPLYVDPESLLAIDFEKGRAPPRRSGLPAAPPAEQAPAQPAPEAQEDSGAVPAATPAAPQR